MIDSFGSNGIYNRASREPERAPLGAKMASQADSAVCSGCSGPAQAVPRHAQECSPPAQVKAAGSCSRPNTKTELAKKKVESDFRGNLVYIFRPPVSYRK